MNQLSKEDLDFASQLDDLFGEDKSEKNNKMEKKEVKKEKNLSLRKNEVSSIARCPSSNIEDCLMKIAPVVQKNGAKLIYNESLCADMGYSVGGGATLGLIASLKYYGILESAGDKVKINKDIVSCVLEETVNEELIKKCILSVPVNKKIFEKYDFEDLPGDNTLKVFLVNEFNYSVKKAEQYLKIFRENIVFYNSKKKNENNTYELDLPINNNNENVIDVKSRYLPEISTNVGAKNDIDNFVIVLPVGKNEFKISMPKNIDDMSLDDIEDFEDVLELLSKRLNRQKRKIEGDRGCDWLFLDFY